MVDEPTNDTLSGAAASPVPNAPAMPPAVAATVPASNFMDHVFSAMKRGAALIYHDVMEVELQVSAWSANPAVQTLVNEGVSLGTTFLVAHGIPVPALEVAALAVLSALKEFAALDATVKTA